MTALIALMLFEIVIWHTYPGYNVPDLRRPAIVIDEEGNGYQTYPGTTVPDLRQPGFKIERQSEWPRPYEYRTYTPENRKGVNLWQFEK